MNFSKNTVSLLLFLEILVSQKIFSQQSYFEM